MPVLERGLTKNEIVAQLARSPHGKLTEYLPIGMVASQEDPEFLSHLIAWNRHKGQVRDSKVALPVFMLGSSVPEFRENAQAHLATLDPRSLIKAMNFANEIKAPGRRQSMRKLVHRYLEALERNWARWERTTVQHRNSIFTLYGRSHYKAQLPMAGMVLRGEYPEQSTFAAIQKLKDMAPMEVAGAIMGRKIPFLVARGALGARIKDPDILMALIERMSPTELVTNMKWLEELGVKTVPALRAALEQALTKASGSMANMLKTSVAVEEVEDEGIKEQLKGLQERQIQKHSGIDGDWLVLGDMSSSMNSCIETARHIAGTLAKFVKGQVDLVFFNTAPRHIDVTGKSYEEIAGLTKHINAQGGTSIGCGLDWALKGKRTYGGIAIVSDGGENHNPWFVDVYGQYVKQMDVEPTVYFYRMAGDPDAFTPMFKDRRVDVQTFDLSKSAVDYYSIPQIVQTMRTNQYSLIDEIMAVPLLTLAKVLG